MVMFRRFAYNMVLIPALLIASGCGGETSKAPEGAPTDEADLTPPETDLGTESTDSPGGSAQRPGGSDRK